MKQKYDIIGDIHGHASELARLLDKLGYRQKGGTFKHPERKAIFLGDFIDRGPRIRETLQIAKSMIDQGQALAVMGNHEFNAICYHTPKPGGGHLRENNERNENQHQKTLDEFSGREDELKEWVRWFRTLPLYRELPGFRVIHAQWSDRHIEDLNGARLLDDELLQKAASKGTAEFKAIEVLLKGTELSLPNGITFTDNDGHVRQEVRVKWWLRGENKTFREMCIPESDLVPAISIPAESTQSLQGYPKTALPVFVGHYWLNSDRPAPVAQNVACLDYSVAQKGMLVSYPWDGEQTLDAAKFVAVPAEG